MKFANVIQYLPLFPLPKTEWFLYVSALKYSHFLILRLHSLVTLTLTKGQGHWSKSKVLMLCTYPANLIQISCHMTELWSFQFLLFWKWRLKMAAYYDVKNNRNWKKKGPCIITDSSATLWYRFRVYKIK